MSASPEIDEDHKRFASLINALNRAIPDHMGLDEVKSKMQAIIDDGVQHFDHEERLFREWNYPDADDHAGKHAQAVQRLGAIMEKLNACKSLEPEWIKAGLEVKDILIEHLLTEDMKYAEFYRNSRN